MQCNATRARARGLRCVPVSPSAPNCRRRQRAAVSRPPVATVSLLHVVLRSSPCMGSNTPAAQTTVSAVALPRDRCRYCSPNWRRPRP
eukprot:201019-Prymnesium_polylepis.1